jgi:hypothetical protein
VGVVTIDVQRNVAAILTAQHSCGLRDDEINIVSSAYIMQMLSATIA